MAAKTYDPSQVAIIVGGFQVTGFADGSFLTVERNADNFALYIGTDGEGTRAKSNNKSGRMTFTLAQSSDANAFLSALVTADELSNSGIVPVLVKDNSGTSLYSAETAWIVKHPAAEFGREIGTREWILETDSLAVFTGGN
jgi:type IV secretory pathway TrbL component